MVFGVTVTSVESSVKIEVLVKFFQFMENQCSPKIWNVLFSTKLSLGWVNTIGGIFLIVAPHRF